MRTNTEDSTMETTWLVQRLEAPLGGLMGKNNPFTFGGGLQNGGLSGEAMDLLQDIFRFDYMGAAEFEFGAVPKALQGLAADSEDLVAYFIQIPLAEVEKHWRDKSRKPPEGDATVYVICREAHVSEVDARIRLMAANEMSLKERAGLADILRPDPDPGHYVARTCGWLELDNGFFFFTDPDMWSKTAALFGVKEASG